MQNIGQASDLVTTKAARIAGFVSQSEEKIVRSRSYSLKIERVRQEISASLTIDQIFEDANLRSFFIGASCLSTKSLAHFSESDVKAIVAAVIDLSKLGDPDYLNELVGRCYLTAGDSLGGSMRNHVGQIAQQKLTNAVLIEIKKRGYPVVVEKNSSDKVTAIEWGQNRMVFDKKPKFINKSIDFIVHKIDSNLEDPNGYLSCGELKGGIDPAGADEHWKTAKSALDRINTAFSSKECKAPNLYFVAGAIESSMADEIFGHLQTGFLFAAANLNSPQQLSELVSKLVGDD